MLANSEWGSVRAPSTAPLEQPLPRAAELLSPEQWWAQYNRVRGDEYALDGTPRRLAAGEKSPTCDASGLQVYRGQELSFGGSVRAHPAFVARLQRFEQVVKEVALVVYGRAPTRVRHLGSYACRNSRFRSQRISEHALGNAIDVTGFDFGPAPKAERDNLPRHLRWGFSVRVDRHFNATKGEAALVHREFLRQLTEALVEQDVFRVLLGPSHRGHDNHFHFDMSPWSYVHL